MGLPHSIIVEVIGLTLSDCFQSVQIVSFSAYREGPMPILMFSLEMILYLYVIAL